MPKFKVLGGRWGEGYEPGQVIELDSDAASRRLELGEIELAGSVEVQTSEVETLVEQVVEAIEDEVKELIEEKVEEIVSVEIPVEELSVGAPEEIETPKSKRGRK